MIWKLKFSFCSFYKFFSIMLCFSISAFLVWKRLFCFYWSPKVPSVITDRYSFKKSCLEVQLDFCSTAFLFEVHDCFCISCKFSLNNDTTRSFCMALKYLTTLEHIILQVCSTLKNNSVKSKNCCRVSVQALSLTTSLIWRGPSIVWAFA